MPKSTLESKSKSTGWIVCCAQWDRRFLEKMSTCFNDLQYQHNYVGVYCTLWTFPTIYAQFENDSCRLTRLSLALDSSLCICRVHIYEIKNSLRRWNDKVYFASFSKTDKQIRKLREHRSSQYLQYSAHSMSRQSSVRHSTLETHTVQKIRWTWNGHGLIQNLALITFKTHIPIPRGPHGVVILFIFDLLCRQSFM